MELTTAQAAYLAGAIDGEGSIQVGSHRRVPTHAPTYYCHVSVTNTKLAWLETLQAWAGGTVYKVGSPHSRSARRQCYRLDWRGPESRELLPIIRPYLLIKGPHADLVLEYFDLASRRRMQNAKGVVKDPALVVRIEEIHSQVKELNLRGTKSAPPRYRVPLEQLCGISSCNRRRYSNGYCKVHYKKYIERGGPVWHERKCEVCPQVFVAKRSDARFCSKICSGRAYYLARVEASRVPSSAVPEATVPSQAVVDG